MGKKKLENMFFDTFFSVKLVFYFIQRPNIDVLRGSYCYYQFLGRQLHIYGLSKNSLICCLCQSQ